MAMIMGSVENDKCLSNMGFMKNKLRNRLTTHLDIIVRMFAQKFFTLNTSPFTVTMSFWTITKSCHGAKG
jgi:hypothetical protein